MMVYPRGDDVAFVGQLDTINAPADASPGLVWRLQTDDGHATSIRAYDARLIVKLSVCTSLEALTDGFVYASHTAR